MSLHDDPPRWDNDTVADLRNCIATRIKWALGTDTSVETLLERTQSYDGNADLSDILSNERLRLPLAKPRVLREAAISIQSLEEAVGVPYVGLPSQFWNQDEDRPIGNVLGSDLEVSDWRDVTRRQLSEVIDLFSACCAEVFGDTLYEQTGVRTASSVRRFLSSQAFGNVSDLTFLKDADLSGWETDSSALENVLRGLTDSKEWIEPWLSSQSPQNYVTGPYTNFWNWLILSMVAASRKYSTGFWATRKQWSDRGYEPKRHQQGAPIFRFFQGTALVDHDGQPAFESERTYQGFRSTMSVVFNGDQVRRKRNGGRFQPVQRVVTNEDVEQCLQNHDMRIRHGREFACYDPGEDVIHMPPLDWFQGSGSRRRATADYYATLLHEVVHWTGHSSRLARYVSCYHEHKEELIAEIGSAFLRARFGMAGVRRANREVKDLDQARHAAYISYWLGNDPVDVLLEAAYEANRACSFIRFSRRC